MLQCWLRSLRYGNVLDMRLKVMLDVQILKSKA